MSEVCGPSNRIPCPTNDNKLSWGAFLDKNIAYIKFVVIGTGFLGACYAARSIRLTQKFKTPSDIPEEFFRKNFRLFGIIRDFTPHARADSPSMVDMKFLVEHVPIAQYPRLVHILKQKFDRLRGVGSLESENLVIQLPGVKLHKRYVDVVKQRSIYQKAAIILLGKTKSNEGEHVLAHIFVKEQGRIMPPSINLGHFIAKNGYGAVTPAVEHPEISESHVFKQYYAKLLQLEETAAKKKKGMWSDPSSDDSGLFPSGTSMSRRFLRRLQKIYLGKLKKKEKDNE